MATPYIDHVSLLEANEVNGVLRACARLVRVVGLVDVDYNALNSALTTVGVPRYGDPLPGLGFEQLVCVKRSVHIVDSDSGTFDVTLHYEHILDGPNQNLYSPPLANTIFGRTSTTVQQKPTNYYVDGGQGTGGQRTQIIVGHTFPDGVTPLPLTLEGDLAGKVLEADLDFPGKYFEQGGEINVMYPSTLFEFEGTMKTLNPSLIESKLVTSVNSLPWKGKPARTWMCMEAKYELLTYAIISNTYKFHFQFQYDPDTWDRRAVFIDQRTGKPPVGLLGARDVGVQNLAIGVLPGYQDVQSQNQVDFNAFFGVLFEGWNGVN